MSNFVINKVLINITRHNDEENIRSGIQKKMTINVMK